MDRIDFQQIFEQSESLLVIVKPDFSVVSVSDGFLQMTDNKRDSVEGRYIFDLFPKSLPDIHQVLINTMRESFQNVLESKSTETSPVVRYEIPIGDPKNKDYETKYWKAVNTPILDRDQNVKYIKQRYVDVTDSRELTSQIETEKKNLDEYKKAEDYIRSAFKQAPAPICVLRGPEHIIEMANRKFLRIVARKDIIGKPAREAVPEIEGQGFFKILDEVYETEKTYFGSEMPIRFNYGDNRVSAYVDFVFQILCDSEGNKTGIFVLGMDVTKQVYARKKAEESEYRYRMLIEKSTVAMALFIGPEFIIQHANDKMLALWDKDSTVLNKPLGKALPELKGQQFQTQLEKVYETGETYTGTEEKAKLLVDGKLQSFYFDYTYTALYDKDGKIYGIQNIAIDVTEKVRAKRNLEKREGNLKRLLDSMPQKISHTDHEGNVVFFNQQWTKETGKSPEELKGEGWIEKVHPEDFSEVKEKWVNAVQACSSLEVEFRIKHKELGYRWNLTRSVPIYGDTGEVIMWIASSTDIHEQKEQKDFLENAVRERTKELELANKKLLIQVQEKEKQKKELEAANKELESFAYISSHDLQEPLRKIQTFAGRIREKENMNLTDKGKDYFSRLEDSADRMRILIEDLLYFSRVNNAEDRFELINLENFIFEIVEDFSDVIEEKNAEVEINELCESNFIAFQLRQLLKNLFSNALKFSKPDTPPHIVISSRILSGSKVIHENPELPTDKLNPEQDYCHIIFEDNGIGFDPTYNERIFEVFQRLHRDQYAGTGIGLAIVKKIVDNHNGIITAESEPGNGARFDIYIPVEQENG